MALIITDIKSDISETTDQILKKALKKVSLSERDISKAEIYQATQIGIYRNQQLTKLIINKKTLFFNSVF